jgi:quercetin dioxygenase-like cupin family protein
MSTLTVDPALTLGLVVTDLVRRTELWQPHVRFTAGRRHAVRIAAADTYEAWLLTFRPGQSTGWHDHGGSAGAFAVVDGALRERVHTDRGTTERLQLPGAITAFDRAYVHDVAALYVPTVSIHVASPALTTMGYYDLRAGQLALRAQKSTVEDW